jgi:peptidoglycan lytic transglycosylase
MTGVATWGEVGVLAARGEEPAGRRGAASRRRFLGLALVFAVGASSAGAVLGLLRQPDPQGQLDSFAWTTAAALETARHAEERSRSAQRALADAQARVNELSAFGAAQELADWKEAEQLGVSRFMKDSTALWGDERRRVEAAIVREARRNGLDPLLVAAVIQVESRFDPFAVSGVGACGLMQLMPPTAQWLLDKDSDTSNDGKLRPAHLFNPVLNIELGTTYLAQLMDRFDGDLSQALIAYNAGPGVARQVKRGSKAWRRLEVYPKSVLAAYKALLLPPQQLAAR